MFFKICIKNFFRAKISVKSLDFNITFMENYMEKKPNQSIHCTVKSCAHHNKTSDYCVLDKINVGTHEADPTVCECVDCESFVLDNCSKGNCMR